MIGILKKIQITASNRTTYKAGLLQAKAYRILKQRTADGLTKYGISTVEWALLGLLYEREQGMRSLELARQLGVEPPFITVLFKKLQGMNLVDSKNHATDSRVKIIGLTEKGRTFVAKTESALRAHMQPLLHDVSIKDLMSYLAVLQRIIENSESIKIKSK